jgi:hypothetical protein
MVSVAAHGTAAYLPVVEQDAAVHETTTQQVVAFGIACSLDAVTREHSLCRLG